jgi:hypothetical protein
MHLVDKIDPIAIYAAVLSTFVFLWNVYVWWNSGPKLAVSATMNMLVIGGFPTDDEKKLYLIVRATNVGSKKTTVTNVVIFSFNSLWQRLRGRPAWAAVFNNTDPSYRLPYILDVGHNFSSRADQTGLVEKIRDTYFYAGVEHSFSGRLGWYESNIVIPTNKPPRPKPGRRFKYQIKLSKALPKFEQPEI